MPDEPLASTSMETAMTRWWIWSRPLLRRRTACTAFSLAVIALLVAACSTTSGATSTAAGTSAASGKPAVGTTSGVGRSAAADALPGSYVALGDSYVAGLDIPDHTG